MRVSAAADERTRPVFSTFADSTAGEPDHAGEWLDEVAMPPLRQNEQYVELMDTPDFGHAAKIAYKSDGRMTPANCATPARASLRDEIASLEPTRRIRRFPRRIEHCGTPQKLPGCKIASAISTNLARLSQRACLCTDAPRFKTASADPRFVGSTSSCPRRHDSNERLRMHMKSSVPARTYPDTHQLHAASCTDCTRGLCSTFVWRRDAMLKGSAMRRRDARDRPYELLKEMP